MVEGAMMGCLGVEVGLVERQSSVQARSGEGLGPREATRTSRRVMEDGSRMFATAVRMREVSLDRAKLFAKGEGERVWRRIKLVSKELLSEIINERTRRSY